MGLPGLHFRLHRLGHHNGIIHYRADDKHKGKECQGVQREARHIQEAEGADERDHNGH